MRFLIERIRDALRERRIHRLKRAMTDAFDRGDIAGSRREMQNWTDEIHKRSPAQIQRMAGKLSRRGGF